MKREAWVPFLMLGTAAISIATAFGVPERIAPKPSAVPAAAAAVDPRPPAELVEDFDRLIQARFEDLRDGKFGVSRVMTREPRHGMVFHPKGERERLALQRFVDQGWAPAMYVVEPRSPELLRGGVIGPIVTGDERRQAPHADTEIEGLAARAMSARQPARGTISGIPMEARPVLASNAACIRCHADKQVGDALGAVVYSFRPDGFAPLAAK